MVFASWSLRHPAALIWPGRPGPSAASCHVWLWLSDGVSLNRCPVSEAWYSVITSGQTKHKKLSQHWHVSPAFVRWACHPLQKTIGWINWMELKYHSSNVKCFIDPSQQLIYLYIFNTNCQFVIQRVEEYESWNSLDIYTHHVCWVEML